MSVLNLVLYPDAPLQEVAERVDEAAFGPDLVRLAEDMLETMHVHEGVGLAAPQVGLRKRLFVMHEPEKRPLCLVNPQIVAHSDETESGEEGCLSLPELYAPVTRSLGVQVRAFDPRGKELNLTLEGLGARIVQHEYDHLEGGCFVDRLDILTREDKLAEWDALRARILAMAAGK